MNTATKPGRNVCIYLDGPLYAELSHVARLRRTTVSKVIKEKLTGKSQQLSAYDRIKDLIGTVDGPRDLSTNPKYMEGFGEDMQPTKRRK